MKALLRLVCLAPLLARADVIYQNDFEGTVGPEWSNTSTDVTPVGARGFLGQFGSAAVSLTVTGIATHSEVTVSFDLFIIRSWDGQGIDVGPDIWDLSVEGGTNLLHATFSNLLNCAPDDRNQAYPGTYPGGNFPQRTGASETNSLGYHLDVGFCNPAQFVYDTGDTVYHLTFTFPDASSSLVWNFSASLVGPGGPLDLDESWGLDNVVVSTPGSSTNETCTVSTVCPCDGGWRNHGKYVSCVAHTANACVEAGLITDSERSEIVSQAAKSSCGKGNKRHKHHPHSVP